MFSTVPEFPFFGFAVRPAFQCGAAPRVVRVARRARRPPRRSGCGQVRRVRCGRVRGSEARAMARAGVAEGGAGAPGRRVPQSSPVAPGHPLIQE